MDSQALNTDHEDSGMDGNVNGAAESVMEVGKDGALLGLARSILNIGDIKFLCASWAPPNHYELKGKNNTHLVFHSSPQSVDTQAIFWRVHSKYI